MANLFKERLKTAEGSPQMPASTPERQPEGIVFQQLSPSGSFVRTVTAYPGVITFVRESAKGQQQVSFRESILGMDKSAPMTIRSGGQEIHRTEISLAGTSAEISKAPSVKEALRAAGAPEARIREILREIGMENSIDAAPNTLSAQMLKRLAIAAALYQRARIVHLDRPFNGIDQAWVERLARMLIEAGELPTRVLLITGEAKIPAVWRDHPKLSIQDAGGLDMKLPTHSAVSAGLQNLARTMISASGLLREQTGDVVTRPQGIYPAPRPNGREALQSEAISNPHVELPDNRDVENRAKMSASIEGVQAEKRGREAEAASHTSKRTPSGKLTKVSTILRIKQSGPANTLRSSAKKIRGAFTPGPREEALLPPVKRTMMQVQNLQRKRVMIGVSAVAVVLFGLWCWGAWEYRVDQSSSGGSEVPMALEDAKSLP